ncbi:MAG: hypothetical protein PVH87_15825 [Desulfobacteraceae bacterium]|jgi:hypothetical protein
MTDKDHKDISEDKSAQSQENDDRLSKDEKMAFEKIMAEIGDEDTAASSKTEDVQADENGGKATPEGKIKNAIDDQQSSSGNTEADISSDNETDDLNDEQQAALDKIMAEINGENQTDTPDPETANPEPEPEAGSDELDDEQQAALDKIMAEINGDEDVQASSPESAADHKDEILSADDGPGENATENEDPSPGQVNLSIEEFDDELNNLISMANAQAEASGSETAGESEEKQQSKTGDGNATVTPTELKTESSDSNKDQPEPVRRKDPHNPLPSDSDNDCEYAILHEITPSEAPNPANAKQKGKPKGRKHKPKIGKKAVWYATAALMLFSMTGTGYWYFGFRSRTTAPALLEPDPTLTETVRPAQIQIPPLQTPSTTEPENEAPQKPVQTAAAMSVPSSESPVISSFVSLKENIASTRQHILNKIEEIKELKAYYQNGIQDEKKKIRDALPGKTLPPLKAALKKRQIELSLRAIQRRKVYIKKLDAPIKLLTSSSEKLLFLERKTRLYETLNQGVSGLSTPEFKQKVADIIGNHLKASNELSIDDIHVKPPSLDALWAALRSENTGSDDTQKASSANHAQDQKIAEEICAGRFERKYLLSELTPESAQCLAKWTGKDLYLNSLTDLPPSIAKIISQWQGEWLSLNGIKALSPDSAKYLAQWKGKRLSLNGLTRLSRRATSQLAKWKGEQLEMVGLEKIGRWENYGTRLYLSESLRRKLQVQ